jgi:hypothetical protein
MYGREGEGEEGRERGEIVDGERGSEMVRGR